MMIRACCCLSDRTCRCQTATLSGSETTRIFIIAAGGNNGYISGNNSAVVFQSLICLQTQLEAAATVLPILGKFEVLAI